MARKYRKRKSRKKDWVSEHLDQYYSRKGIAAIVRNTPVDWSRHTDRDPTEVYERYQINQFTSKEQFRDYFIKNGLVDEKLTLKKRERLLDKMWNDYVHREQLMITGQYDEIRTQIFKDNYIKALVAIGVPNVYIKALEKAGLNEWSKMATLPNPNKDEDSPTKLPHLGGFAYSTKGDNERRYDMAKILTDVISAMLEAGITIPSLNPILDEDGDLSEEDMRANNAREKEYQEEVVRLRQVIRLIPKDEVEGIRTAFSAEDARERALSVLSYKTKSGAKRIKKSKSGNLYIPFVGSQRSPRTRELIADIITEFERRGLTLEDFVEGWNKS